VTAEDRKRKAELKYLRALSVRMTTKAHEVMTLAGEVRGIADRLSLGLPPDPMPKFIVDKALTEVTESYNDEGGEE
jgi:hypothetical protein